MDDRAGPATGRGRTFRNWLRRATGGTRVPGTGAFGGEGEAERPSAGAGVGNGLGGTGGAGGRAGATGNAAGGAARWPLPRPLHCEWAWRPAPWTAALQPPRLQAAASGQGLAPGVTLHHDAAQGQPGFCQHDRSAGAPAPFALELTAAGVRAGYVSLALDLPPGAWAGLGARHLLGLTLALEGAVASRLYLRFNIAHGPNLAQLLREVGPELQAPAGALIEVDLAYAEIRHRRIHKLWCDLILEGPEIGGLCIADVVFTRRPRAEP